MHYLMKLVKSGEIADPVKNAPDVHKHFTRYSKGHFDGPIVKISVIGKKISIGCSFEYEDASLELALKYFPDANVEMKGTLLSGGDFSGKLKNLGFGGDFEPEKSKGQTKNYTTVLKTAVTVPKEKLLALAKECPMYLYALLTFASADKEVSITTKPKPPRPNSKNPEDSNPANLIKFCSLKLPNTPEALKDAIEFFAADYKDEIPAKFKSIQISNSYEITDLKLPDNKDKIPSEQIRLQTLRKGILHRVAEIDEKAIKKDIPFSA